MITIFVGILCYAIIGLIAARASATYFTEKNKLEGKGENKLTGRRPMTFEEWKEETGNRGYTHKRKDLHQYSEDLNTYGILYKVEEYEFIPDSWQADHYWIVCLLPFIWLPLVIGYYPMKYGAKGIAAIGRFTVSKIDYIGKELANPKGNV